MSTARRKLIVLLCMHRTGSSLTASILEKLGMSLGPFDLLGAMPGNPHGHFESLPFHFLNNRVMKWAFGFFGDVPSDPETLARFVESKGGWPVDREIPRALLEEGERIARGLVESGPVCGFKEPQTVLTWPFWRRVLQSVEDLEVAPVMLVRSPHEIAMSLCVRSDGALPYWGALDVVGIHYARMLEIARELPKRPPVARFATARYWDDLREMVNRLGLAWSDEVAKRVYKPSSVNQLPAIVSHPAQGLFDELCEGEATVLDPESNSKRLAEDARRVEALMYARMLEKDAQLDKALHKLRRISAVVAATDPFLDAAAKGKRRAKKIWLKFRGRDENPW